jgi:hypothetical protein
MSDGGDAVEVRREWERQQAALIADSHRRHEAELRRRDEVEQRAHGLRDELGQRLAALMENMEPYVDGTMGEVTASMASVYVRVAHELAGLYELTRAPRKLTPRLPVPEPEAVKDEATVTAERAAAMAAAREAGLRQLEAVRVKMLPPGSAS